MIKKTLLCCLVLLCVHAALIAWMPHLGKPTHQFQDNVVKVQSFLYDRSPYVIVGTSLSARILKDSIPDVSSIAFGGSSVENGLRLVLTKPVLPRVLFVETNLILRESDSTFIEQAVHPLMFQWKRLLPSFREQYQPICLFADAVFRLSGINPQSGAAKINRDFLNRSIGMKIASDTLYHTAYACKRMERIDGLLNEIEKRGTRLVFFEMPVHDELKNLGSFDQVRTLIHSRYPDAQYSYIPCDTASYITTDGIHLDYDGQLRFTAYFRSHITPFLAVEPDTASPRRNAVGETPVWRRKNLAKKDEF